MVVLSSIRLKCSHPQNKMKGSTLMINKLEINPLYNISHLFPSAIEMVCYVLFLNTINELPEKLFSGYII